MAETPCFLERIQPIGDCDGTLCVTLGQELMRGETALKKKVPQRRV
jgi:hypothetical protein